MTHPLSIVVDIDDVLFPWCDNAHQASLAAGLVPEGFAGQRTYQPWQEYGHETPDRWWEALRQATYAGELYLGAPYRGALHGMWRLEAAGHSLHLVTARGTYGDDTELKGLIRVATVNWLAEHHVPYDTLTFSHDKTCVPADFAVDDRVENYDALEAAGVAVWLVDQPWNQDVPGRPRRRRVNDLSEFADIILAKEAQLA